MSQSGGRTTAAPASVNPMHRGSEAVHQSTARAAASGRAGFGSGPSGTHDKESRRGGRAGSKPAPFRSGSRRSLVQDAYKEKPWFIVVPDNLVFTYVWRPIRFLLLVWAATVVPVVVSFDPFSVSAYDSSANGRLNTVQQSAFHRFVLVIDILFMLDLISNFFLAVLDERRTAYVVSPREIGARYLRGWFAVDFIAAFPLDLVFEAAMGNDGNSVTRMTRSLRLARVLRLMRIAKVAHLNEVLEGLEDKFRLSPAVARILRTVIGILLLLNLIGAGWHGIFVMNQFMDGSTVQPCDASVDPGECHGWVDVFGYSTENVWTKYVASIYWAFMTLSTVGFGEIHPTSSAEQVFAMFTMMIGVTVYALVISSASSAMLESNSRQAKIVKRRRAVRELCRACPSIQNGLRDRMLRYLERKSGLHDRMVSAEQQKEVLAHLSPQLQQEALLQINDEKTHALLFFGQPYRGSFSGDFLARIAQSAEYLCVEKDDIVCEEKTATTDMFLCVTGTLRVYKDGRIVGTATAKADDDMSVGGQNNNLAWGMTECVNGTQHHESIVAGDRCHFYMLKAETVRELQNLFPQDHDRLRGWVRQHADLHSFLKRQSQEASAGDAHVQSSPATRMIERHAQLAARGARNSFSPGMKTTAVAAQAGVRLAHGANHSSPRVQRHSMFVTSGSVTPRGSFDERLEAERSSSPTEQQRLKQRMSASQREIEKLSKQLEADRARSRQLAGSASPQPLSLANSASNTAVSTTQQQHV